MAGLGTTPETRGGIGAAYSRVGVLESAEMKKPKKSPIKVIAGRVRRHSSTLSIDVENTTSSQPAPSTSNSQALKEMFFQPLNILLLCIVPALVGAHQEWGCGAVFTFNFLAILPLAGLLGHATEMIAISAGHTLGGLLNATFGNAVEMILAVLALKRGLIHVVQGSLLGSILSNLLLVLGMCFICGGRYFHVQKFSITAAQSQSALLLLSVLALVVPTLVMNGQDVHNSHHRALEEATSGEDAMDAQRAIDISRPCAVVLAVSYVIYLIFQLGTHSELFAAEEDDDDSATMSPSLAITMLFIVTMVVSVCSEGLVDSIEGLTEEFGLTPSFIGIVLLPIVGNAAEHMTAVTVAIKNKMDLSIGVALGSSTQIALFVVPFTVLSGWVMDIPMHLAFTPVETAILLITVLIVSFVTSDGESNYMEGVMLIAAYAMTSVTFWFVT